MKFNNVFGFSELNAYEYLVVRKAKREYNIHGAFSLNEFSKAQKMANQIGGFVAKNDKFSELAKARLFGI